MVPNSPMWGRKILRQICGRVHIRHINKEELSLSATSDVKLIQSTECTVDLPVDEDDTQTWITGFRR